MLFLRKLLDPDSSVMKSQGFKPNFLIKIIRFISKLLIIILRLNGKSRWSNEFIQSLDPYIVIKIPLFKDKKIWFRTGHGRLYWRTRHSFEIEPETNEWIKSFNNNDVFYDIGANIGFYTLIASKIKGVKTFSFEPDLMNARLLYENIIKNDVSNVATVIPVALSNKNYCAKLYLSTLSYGDALHNLDTKNSIISGDSEANIAVPTFKLDTAAELLNLDLPTKLKIDVDGIEEKILEGGSNILSNVQEIMVEWEIGSESKKRIKKLLINKNFTYKWESKPHNQYSNTVNAFFKK